MAKIRVLLVDDHPVVRQGLHRLLSKYRDIQVVGDSDGGPKVIQSVDAVQPDVILLDIRLAAGRSGLDIALQLKRTHPNCKIIILTSYDDETYLNQAARACVHGYLLKSASPQILADTIRAVHSGEHRLSPSLAGKAFKQLEVAHQAWALAGTGLSEQEFRMLKLISDGAKVQDIAQTLYISESSVKRKTQDIVEKMGATNRTQAVAEAFRRGLL
ncbi:response regulator transcription factor [Phosphitispora sp. TUW77]|uniref:response regulator transcription factor n=1 Tax=Phosphitispora sp. TUW77 TaxID=3152361 RepID=UPI003AB6A680